MSHVQPRSLAPARAFCRPPTVQNAMNPRNFHDWTKFPRLAGTAPYPPLLLRPMQAVIAWAWRFKGPA